MTTILVPFHANERLPDGDVPVRADVTVQPRPLDGDAWDRLARVCAATADAVAAAPGTPLVFSGDCLIAGGTVAGLQRTGVDPAVVWLDAHGDVHTLETTTSGYLGGLSLRLLTGAHPDRYADRIGLRPVAPERAVLADARDLDPAEADYLSTSAIRRLTVPELSAETVPPGPFVLHVDVDVIDAADLPGLRFPVPHGPSADEVLAACERLVATGRVAALDVACTWFPDAGAAQARLIARLAGLI
ncbi:arginase family protein [Actinoplanes sp. M2I2]|uniref:arginase family protein n=1 Tax=Actinoplanes sp. M2I2 TaxID=1734444 RepID=UPI0020218575|nr:arginase family protein [Actinoplanes sp. M2I2]